MTVEELLKYSASEIKGDRALFSEFVKLYIAQGGSKGDCMSCNFSKTYTSWKRKLIRKKPVKMANKKNTFTLKDPNRKYYIQNEGAVLNENSTDDVAFLFLNQFDKKYYKERSLVFSKLPKEQEEVKVIEEKETVKEEVKEEVKAKVKPHVSKRNRKRK